MGAAVVGMHKMKRAACVSPVCSDGSSFNLQIPHAVRYHLSKVTSAHPDVSVCTSTAAAFLIQTSEQKNKKNQFPWYKT